MTAAIRGKFVVFEGIDGAGTTTQLARYGAHLRSLGQAVHLTREPSAGPVGSMLRLALSKRLELGGATHAQTMALLFAADRLDHVAHEIEPHLALGTHVLSDRYDLSSLAYQTATTEPAHNPGVDAVLWVRSLNRFALRPDATVVLDVSPDVAAQRRDTRAAQIELYERQDLQAKLAALYRDAERLVPGDCILHIDGNASADAVTFAVIAALAPRR